MQASCFQENLAKGLSLVSRAVSTRNVMPVLGNILIEAKGNQLRLAATNREIGISCWISAKVEDEGAITVPARLLSDFVNKLPPERIDLVLAVRTQTLHLHCARYVAEIKGIDAYEFPLIPTLGSATDGDSPKSAGMVAVRDGIQFELELSGLRKMIDQVIFAASASESQPVFTGVEVSFKADETAERLLMAASDGHRLSLRSITLDLLDGPTDLTIIVPARNLGELARISADADPSRPVRVIVTRERNQILFQLFGKNQESKGTFQRIELVSELIDARYPDYRAIIPKQRRTRATVDTADLLNAVEVAFLFARDNANIVHLRLLPNSGQAGSGNGQIRLTASSQEMGNNVSELDALIEGEEIELAFNAKYLIDVLHQIDQAQIVLETSQPTRPAMLRPVGMTEEEFLHVLMPMHPSR